MTPPGSTLCQGAVPSAGVVCANHHGTPFIAGSTIVSGRQQRLQASRHLGQRRALHRHHHQVHHAQFAGVGGSPCRCAQQFAALTQPPTMLAQRLQRRRRGRRR